VSAEARLRDEIVLHGRSLYARGLTPGSSGNLSVRLDDGLLVTPTDSCLGRLDRARISRLDAAGRHLSGDRPTKEAFLHLAMYRERVEARAVVHLHSTYAVALSCLADLDPADALPPITAYSVMKIGRLPLVPYHRPGDGSLAEAVGARARNHRAILLANHGPVVSARDLDSTVAAMEELEETARLFFLLRGSATRLLTEAQVRDLEQAFPS
jgi:ribulose-5-phosphate 4-epimerase/fuculose-1-phosphate aldolase